MTTKISKRPSSKPVQDVILNFVAPNDTESACRLLISGTVVVASDLDAGSSITNSAEHLANLVVQKFSIQPEALIWIEHYPVEDASLEAEETFDLVQFNLQGTQFSDPRWQSITRPAAEALFGGPIEVTKLVAQSSELPMEGD